MQEQPAPEHPAQGGALAALAASWAAVGIAALLVYAIVRLVGVVIVGLDYSWHTWHIVVCVVNLVFMAWSEGWRGFQQNFSPRSAARIRWLFRDAPARPVLVLLAPFFAMGYFGTSRRRMIGIWGLTAGIVVLIVIIHSLPQPWRASLDVGVVLGLSWGLVSFLCSLAAALSRTASGHDPEVVGFAAARPQQGDSLA